MKYLLTRFNIKIWLRLFFTVDALANDSAAHFLMVFYAAYTFSGDGHFSAPQNFD